jgi:predicted NUDIX family phosphoesterase
MTQTVQTPVFQAAHDEQILVVQRDLLFPNGAWEGIKAVDLEQYAELIAQKQEFLPRSQMETDPRYKQIIPYLVFCAEDRYFLMQRQAKPGDARLANKYSLGIGGHIRQEDIGNKSIADWAQREFEEEVTYSGTLKIEPIGLLNDDSNAVGQVHVGFIFLLHGDSTNINVTSELKSGVMLPLTEIKDYYDNLESWSKIVFDFLIAKENK